jgi:hypothetical protein
MQNSIKIKLSQYAYLEYEYSGESHLISEYNFNKVSNTTRKISTFINDDTSISYSKNALDYTFIEIDEDKVGHCDIDQPFSLEELNDDIDLDTSLAIPTSFNVKYDTVKIHLLSGYNLVGIDGIGLRISGEENTGDTSYLLSHIYTIDENTVTQSSKPFSIGEQIFDRYIEIKVPSISYLNEQYYNLNTFDNPQLATFLTQGGKGFKQETPIKIEFYQFYNFEEVEGQLTYKYDKILTSSIPQIDPNALISAHLAESDEGDYFEYFAKYDGEFIEDYIAELNSRGQTYTIINEINVYENYSDLTRILVDQISTLQTDNFDKPNKYRPIISDNAFSFIIDYTVRIINQVENTQIIKSASITGDTNAARKYGYRVGQINVQESSAPIKIYNRKTTAPYNLSIDETPPKNIKRIVSEIVRYVDSYKISINAENSIEEIEKAVITGDLEDSNFIYGNGEGVIYISQFDNYLKLKIFNTNEKDSLEALNLNEMVRVDSLNPESLALVFFGPSNTKKYIYAEISTIKENEVVFKIPSRDSSKIVNYVNRRFNLVYTNASGEETNMYEGTFSSTIEDYKKNKNRVFEKTAQQKIQEMNTIFTNTQNKLDQILREVQDDAVINNITNNNIVNNTSNITNTTNRTEAPRENKGQTQIKKKDEVTKKIDQVNFIVEQDPIETDFKLLQEILKSNKEKFEKEKKKVVKNSLDNLADVGTSSKKGNNDIITDFDIKKINFIDLPEVANKLNLDTNINKITPKFLKP